MGTVKQMPLTVVRFSKQSHARTFAAGLEAVVHSFSQLSLPSACMGIYRVLLKEQGTAREFIVVLSLRAAVIISL